MSNSRDQIVDAARRLFVARGYADVSVRDIARAAGVSPALVIKHGGSKRELFRACAAPVPRAGLYDVPLEQLGTHLVVRAVRAQRAGRPSPMTRAVLLLHGAPDPDELRADFTRAYRDPLVAKLREAGVEAGEAGVRAELALTALVGLSLSMRTLQLARPGVANGGDEEIGRRYGALVQAALDGETGAARD